MSTSGLPKDDLEILLLAAWFHDTGMVNAYDHHEEKSIEIFKMFIKEDNLPPVKIEKVIQIIKATKVSSTAGNFTRKNYLRCGFVTYRTKGISKSSKTFTAGMGKYAGQKIY